MSHRATTTVPGDLHVVSGPRAPDFPRQARDVVETRNHLTRCWEPDGPFSEALMRDNTVQWANREQIAVERTQIEWERRSLETAAMWWVSPDMVDLLEHTAPTVPTDITLEPSDLPDRSGLVIFARPVIGIDSAGDEAIGDARVRVDAVLWGQVLLRDPDGSTAPGIGISSYTCYNAGHGERLPAEQMLWEEIRQERGLTPEQWTDVLGRNGPCWSPLGRSDWLFGQNLDHHPQYDGDGIPESVAAACREDRQLVAALFTLARSPGIVEQDRIERPDRAGRRRSARAGFPKTDVRVVSLRRHQTETAEPGESDGTSSFSHRWIRSGHFRSQPYGPGRSKRKLIYIEPHICGPDDKPLLVRPTVKALRR